MTVKQLKEKLDTLPDNLPVVLEEKEMHHYYQVEVYNATLTTGEKGRPVVKIY